MTLMRLMLFILSNLGWIGMLQHRIKIHRSFLPCLLLAIHSSLLLAGGLLNLLLETAAILWVIGTVAILYYTVKEKGKNWETYLNTEYLFLFLLSVLFLFYLRGKVFTHYDNFSHWAVAVRALLNSNRLPNFETPHITFQEYPLGSSIYIYYFSRIVGDTESLQMFSQVYMMLTCMLPIMKNSEKHPWLILIMMFFAANFFFAYNVQVTELLVDTLLPLVGMYALLLIDEYKTHIREGCLPITFVLIWLIQIKASALFFVLLASIAYLFIAKKNRQLQPAVVSLVAVFLSLLLWKRHCSYVFPAEIVSKHSISLAGWQMSLESKSMEDIKHIILSLGEYAISWPDFWGLMAMLAVMGLGCFLLSKNHLQKYGMLAAVSFILYAGWQIGLLFTYVFSMPRGEAFSLSSINRYEKTIIVAISYLLWTALIRFLSTRDKLSVPSVIAALLISLASFGLLRLSGSPLTAVSYVPYRIGRYNGLEARTWIERMKEEYHLPAQGKIALLIEDWDSEYFYFLGCYIFPEAQGMTQITKATWQDLEEISDHYLLIHDPENEEIQKWVLQHDPNQAGNELIIPEYTEAMHSGAE